MTLATDHLKHPLFAGVSAQDRLVWLYILEHGEGAYSTRLLARETGGEAGNIARGVKQLLALGLLEAATPVRHGRTTRLRAVPPAR